jgi:hypothetical protein
MESTATKLHMYKSTHTRGTVATPTELFLQRGLLRVTEEIHGNLKISVVKSYSDFTAIFIAPTFCHWQCSVQIELNKLPRSPLNSEMASHVPLATAAHYDSVVSASYSVIMLPKLVGKFFQFRVA